MRPAAAIAVAAVLMASACDTAAPRRAAPAPVPSASASALPARSAELGARLRAVADRLARPGDGIAAQQERADACIDLTRLRDHARKHAPPLLNGDLAKRLAGAAAGCSTDPARAASAIRAVADDASRPPPG